MRKLIVYLMLMAFLIVAPFVLLIRGAVFMHTNHGWHAWMALLAGTIFTGVLLLLYFLIIQGRLTGDIGGLDSLKQKFAVVMVIVLVYSLHGILSISPENIQNPKVRNEFSELHPILRASLSTLIHLDEKLILTDASRLPEDYRRMGLKTNQRSLHYKQKNGFVHAVDLRTQGRSALRNRLIEFYFKLMGFNTLRHVGTADHLHISLKSHDQPGSI